MSLSCEFAVVLTVDGCIADLGCAVITIFSGLRRRLRIQRDGSRRKPRRVRELSVVWISGSQIG